MWYGDRHHGKPRVPWWTPLSRTTRQPIAAVRLRGIATSCKIMPLPGAGSPPHAPVQDGPAARLQILGDFLLTDLSGR